MSEAKALKKFNYKKFFKENNTLIIFILLIIVSACLSSNFLTYRNITNVLRQQVPYVLLGIGSMLVIMTGGIDLSCGAILGVGSVVIALFLERGNVVTVPGLMGCVVLTALIGALVGLANGVLVAYCKMAAFIATLAVMTIAQGIAYILTSGQPIRLPDTAATKALVAFAEVRDPLIGMPVAVYVALAGIFVTCRAAIGTPATVSGGYELDAIAAVVIGGANLNGGKASVVNTVIGVLIMALIGNIMNLLSIAAYPQKVVKGVIIIASVLLQSLGRKKQ